MTNYGSSGAIAIPQRRGGARLEKALVVVAGSGTKRRPGAMALRAPSLLGAAVTGDQLTLSLPPPPSINHQYATVNGRRILSAAGRGYKMTVMQHVLAALSGSPYRRGLLETLRTHNLSISLRLYVTAPFRRDVDSGLKITQDALCEALGVNDNRVFELHLYKVVAPGSPYVSVSLAPSLCSQTAHPYSPAPEASVKPFRSPREEPRFQGAAQSHSRL